MSVPELFIRRPIMTTLVMAAILLAGIMAYRQLPVNDLPAVDFPTINVSANLPGASPETMASSVATTLEKQFSTIPGLDTMSSVNTQGSTQISLQFTLDRNIDAAAQDVQTAIAQAQRKLPDGMPSPPSYRKNNPADSPIYLISLSSEQLPMSVVDNYAETKLGQQISTISGVAQVQVFGAQKYAVRVQLDPHELASRSLGINEVADAIRNGNVNLPTGSLNGPDQSYTVEASGQLENAAAYRELIVAYRNGHPVHLRELGRVLDDVENNKSISWFNDQKAVILAIFRQPGTNTIEVVDRIKQVLPGFQSQLPAMLHMTTFIDRSESIRASVDDVKFTLLLTICLVILVIFVFLRSFATTIIPSLALPMSIVGTFAGMQLLGFSIDNFSLMALTLSVGFVVDDAIVMLENIVRHREMGKDAMTASLDGSREVGFTIISMTLSLVAVFIPVVFMGGLIGRLLHEFAITISVAILISGFVSLTLTPMLCSRFLGYLHAHNEAVPEGQEAKAVSGHGHLYAATERIFDGMLWTYKTTLGWALHVRWLIVLIAFGLIVVTYLLFKSMPTGFLPDEDIGQLRINSEAAQGISFDSMVQHQLELNKIIAANPNIESYMSTLNGGNSGRFFVSLKPMKDRKLSASEIAQELQGPLARVPGIRAIVTVPPTVQMGARNAKSQYQFTLQGSDLDQLYAASDDLLKQLKDAPSLTDLSTDLQVRNPQIQVDINRDKASTLGLSAHDIEDALYTAYGSRLISTIYKPDDAYNVVLELDPKYQADPSALPLLYVRSSTGELVPLDSFASLRRDVGPLSIQHTGQLPSVTLSFNLAPGVSLSQGVDTVQAAANKVVPASIQTSFQGTAQVFQSSMVGIQLLLLMAVLVIYIVLGILYESFIHPITILSGLPSAAVGALATLKLFHMELNLYGFVGILLLVGIVKKNAIMMIDFAIEAERKEGKSPLDAIYEGCLTRFRPIMMTTLAAMMGGVPIALGLGAGASARRPLGLAIVGGLIFSQLVTLYITPVIYIYLEEFRLAFSKKKHREHGGDNEPPAAEHAPQKPKASGQKDMTPIAIPAPQPAQRAETAPTFLDPQSPPQNPPSQQNPSPHLA